MDAKVRWLLRDLGRALLEAISESNEVSRSLARIHREGYSLHLLVDCQRAEGEEALPVPVVPRRSGAEPAFRIDGNDLDFLRSIGIDPTRRRRAPRAS